MSIFAEYPQNRIYLFIYPHPIKPTVIPKQRVIFHANVLDEWVCLTFTDTITVTPYHFTWIYSFTKDKKFSWCESWSATAVVNKPFICVKGVLPYGARVSSHTICDVGRILPWACRFSFKTECFSSPFDVQCTVILYATSIGQIVLASSTSNVVQINNIQVIAWRGNLMEWLRSGSS